MRIGEGTKTINKLIDEGWSVDHQALFGRYKFSGAVSDMKKRNGYKFCRVHHGQKIGRYQVTTVMKKKEG